MTLDTNAAVAAISAKTKRRPKIAVILGSGLGGLAKDVQDATRISYADIPGFRRSTAPGHAGELVVGTVSGKDVAVRSEERRVGKECRSRGSKEHKQKKK